MTIKLFTKVTFQARSNVLNKQFARYILWCTCESYKYNKSKLKNLKLRVLSSILIKFTFSFFLKKKKKERDWPANNALLRMTYLQQSFLSSVCFINVSVIGVKYSTSRPSKLTGTLELLNCFNAVVLNSMFCLNCVCLLKISLYRDELYVRSAKLSSLHRDSVQYILL